MVRLRLLAKFANRNPRNIEQLGLQACPTGFEMDVDRHKHSFIYRANFERHRNYVEGQVLHYKEGVVLTASSREKQVFQQLYSSTDVSACANIGRLLGLRCGMAGIYFLQAVDSEHIGRSIYESAFFKALAESGIKLGEPKHTEQSFDVDPDLTYDNYEMMHTREDNIE